MISPSAEERSATAVRDHLANERTFLAWVRTAVTFIGLGFAVERLAIGDPIGQGVGIAMIAVGGGMMLPALASFRRTAHAIAAGGYAPPLGTNTLLAAVVVGGAVLLVGLGLVRAL